MKLRTFLTTEFVCNPQYNCAEKVLRGANYAYGLKLDHKVLTMAAPFGSGMAIQKTCGALTGALMVMSAVFVKERAKEGDHIIRALTLELLHGYEAKMQVTDCRDLKEMYFDEQTHCKDIIFAAAEVLDEIIAREAPALISFVPQQD